MSTVKNDLTIVISADSLGRGDDDLGQILMKSYLYALSESKELPNNLIFINSGVKLVAQNSIVLESLTSLKENGVSILSCGTCLDFYGIKDKLMVGEVTNMYNIVQLMNTSKNTIKL